MCARTIYDPHQRIPTLALKSGYPSQSLTLKIHVWLPLKLLNHFNTNWKF